MIEKPRMCDSLPTNITLTHKPGCIKSQSLGLNRLNEPSTSRASQDSQEVVQNELPIQYRCSHCQAINTIQAKLIITPDTQECTHLTETKDTSISSTNLELHISSENDSSKHLNLEESRIGETETDDDQKIGDTSTPLDSSDEDGSRMIVKRHISRLCTKFKIFSAKKYGFRQNTRRKSISDEYVTYN